MSPRNKKTVSIFFTGWLFLAMAALFGVFGYLGRSQYKEMQDHGVTGPGEIQRGWIQSRSKGKKNYHVEVRYQPAGEAGITKDFRINRGTYFRHMTEEGKVVEPLLTVRYLPGQPETSVVEGAHDDGTGVLWVAALLGLGGALFLFFGVVRRLFR